MAMITPIGATRNAFDATENAVFSFHPVSSFGSPPLYNYIITRSTLQTQGASLIFRKSHNRGEFSGLFFGFLHAHFLHKAGFAAYSSAEAGFFSRIFHAVQSIGARHSEE